MIGKMEAIADHPHHHGVFRGKSYCLMSEYAPEEMRSDLQRMLEMARTDHRIVVSPEESICHNSGNFPPYQALIYTQWVEEGKSRELVQTHQWFYDKLENFKKVK